MTHITAHKENIICTILAGGQSRRMHGYNKANLQIHQHSLIGFILQRIRSIFAGQIIINANDNHDFYQQFHCPIVKDFDTKYRGPLAGILASLLWAKQNAPYADYVVSFACDTPFFPLNLLNNFIHASQQKPECDIFVASHNQKNHPIFCLHKVSLYDELHTMLYKNDTRKIMYWIQSQSYSQVDFTRSNTEETSQTEGNPQTITVSDPFFNINTQEDYEKMIASLQNEYSFK